MGLLTSKSLALHAHPDSKSAGLQLPLYPKAENHDIIAKRKIIRPFFIYE
nr:MAG TPA: hypothetical protein [Caudoviricetes sp.]